MTVLLVCVGGDGASSTAVQPRYSMLLRTKDERRWVFIIVKRVSVIFTFQATGIWISAEPATLI